MDIKDILAKVDHTLLDTCATWDKIRTVCDEGIEFGTASVCIPPCFVKQAAEYVEGKIAICTVIGFPNGYQTTAVKCSEALEAVKDGADEIDMVINLGMVKEGKYSAVRDEIRAVRLACGEKILKVIIETCRLTDEEKIEMCRVVSEAGADYIKTSTGFAGGGATREDISLMTANVSPELKIKAAGGIKTKEDAEDFILLGADRLGTSRLVSIAKNEAANGEY
ncbi:MAG: deoxyribose-phosphate aldolase [Ruminococcaceae bacterium]|nr:deoxyribose-phosphate aldolase [Oscillospiraceae bacterium]